MFELLECFVKGEDRTVNQLATVVAWAKAIVEAEGNTSLDNIANSYAIGREGTTPLEGAEIVKEITCATPRHHAKASKEVTM